MILHQNDLLPSSVKGNFHSCYIHVHREELTLKLVEDRSNSTPVTICTPNTQILISKYHSPIKGSRLLEEEADSRVRVRKIQYKPETSGGAKKMRKDGTISKDMGTSLKKLPMANAVTI